MNDIGRALKFMADEGHDVICLAAKSNPSKSIKRSDKTSSHGRLTIFRPWASHQFPAEFPEAAALLANKVLDGLIFDVVLCFQHFNYPLIRRLGHDMKGAGEAYGFGGITRIGAALERDALARDGAATRRRLDELASYLGRVEPRAGR